MKKLIDSKRLLFLGVVLAVLIMVYFVTLYKLQIVEGARYAEESANSRVTTETVAATRGNILDRYGRLLVSSTPCYNITINRRYKFRWYIGNFIIKYISI